MLARPEMHCRYQSASEIFGSGLNKSLVKGITSLSRSDYTNKTKTAHWGSPFAAVCVYFCTSIVRERSSYLCNRSVWRYPRSRFG